MVLIFAIDNFDKGEYKMELRNLITFTHVAELGSFTNAAQQLGYSQSTVSFQIKQRSPITAPQQARTLPTVKF